VDQGEGRGVAGSASWQEASPLAVRPGISNLDVRALDGGPCDPVRCLFLPAFAGMSFVGMVERFTIDILRVTCQV